MSASFVNPLKRSSPSVVETARRVKLWTREMLQLPDNAIVSVNQLTCHLPDCPPEETAIIVMQPGRHTIQVSIHKVMSDITRDDLRNAISQHKAGPI